ncbi:MAG TPA: HEAT repeat domain-containing protein [Polyangiaceae bacterium]|nr:HEAT repeat domain-containing protein [Polyangiaceae bacterium]
MALFHRPLPRTLEAALRDLKEKSVLVRRSAVQDLGRHAREQATSAIEEALLEALRDDDPLVRTEAAYCLGDMKSKRALPLLLVTVDDANSLVRQAAIDALGTIGDPQATGRLLRALEDERPDVRFQAVIALGRISVDTGMDAVLRAVCDEDPHIRYIAVRVAEELVTKELSPTDTASLPERLVEQAKGWLEDEDAHVRLAAAILLGKCGDDAGAEHLLDAIEGRIFPMEPEDEAAAIELAGTLKLHQAIAGLERRAFGWKRWIKSSTWTPRAWLWCVWVTNGRDEPLCRIFVLGRETSVRLR